MNIFSIFRKREAQPVVATGDAAAANNSGNFMERVVRVSTEQKALNIATWYRGLELLMNMTGQLVPQYQRLDKLGGNYVEFKYGEARKLNYLLQQRPNVMMTASEFWSQVTYMRIMHGNAVVYIERNEYGEPRNFWLGCNATYDQQTGTYYVQYLSDHGLLDTRVTSKDVLHFSNTFKYPCSNWGISTLQYAVQVLSLQATNNKQALENSAKGGRFKVIIQEKDAPGTMGLKGGRANQAELKKITRQFNAEIGDDAIFLNNIASAIPFSQTAQQLQLLEQMGFGVAEIGRFLNVPLFLLMDYSNSSYKTPEAASTELMQRTLQPIIPKIEQELNTKLLSPEEFELYRFHMCSQPLMRLDRMGQANVDKILLETGVKTVNELRSQYDLSAVPEGDRHYISTNLAELGSEKLRGGEMPTEPINEE